MNQTITAMDKQIDQLDKKYPEITILRTVPGVGPVVAACYVLTLDSPQAMETNRQAGAYLGLRPRQQKSGDSDPQCNITRMGNTYLRSLLVQSAQYILGRCGPTRNCAAGGSSWLPAVANGAKNAPSLPWPESWPWSCSACGVTARSLNRFLSRWLS